jgi:hypothetical protein
MSLTNAYVAVSDLREQLGDSAEKLNEALLERAINATSRAVDKFCGRRFWTDSGLSTRLYRPEDPYRAMVDDISTATGMVVRTDDNTDGTWVSTWAATDYQLEPLNRGVASGTDTPTAFAWWRIVPISAKFFVLHPRRPTLQVTAQFGWSAVPDDVVQAVLIKAVSLFKRKDAPFGVAGFADFGAVRITRNDPDVTELLGPYTIPGV